MVRRSLTPGPAESGRNALGPRGRGIFDRLFGRPQSPGSPAVRREARAIAIASGKGGTGKSFLSTSLAVVLAKDKLRVALVDCDFGLACDHLLLGVTPKQTLQHVLAGEASLADILMQAPSGPTLVPGASGIRRMANLTDRELLVLGHNLAELALAEDVLILDAGAGISPQTVLTLLCADHVVLVTQPEIAALTDAYAVVKCLVQLKPETAFSVVVNRVMSEGHGEQAFEKLADVSARHAGIDLLYLGEVHDDPKVTQRRLGQQPVVATNPRCHTSREIRAIAGRLREVAGPLEPREVTGTEGLEARFREHRLFL
jgi:flagellar biosynthesis protein FlhG